MSDKFIRKCYECNSEFNKRLGRLHNGNWYCDDCKENIVECYNCNNESWYNNGLSYEDGNWYCEDCVSELFRNCEDCGEPHLEDTMVENDRRYLICEQCRDDNYTTCDSCEELVHNDNTHWLGDIEQTLCEDCYYDETSSCDNCGDRFHNDNMRMDDNNALCEHCYDNHYYTCEACSSIVFEDNVVWHNDYPYCENCAPDRFIRDYGYRPSPIFYGQQEGFGTKLTPSGISINVDTTIYMGIELEVDEGGENDENAAEISKILNSSREYAYFKHDGSINEGFEIVTHPATLEFHKNSVDWKGAMDKLLQLDYKSHDSGTCGLHIHVSRNAFGSSFDAQDINIMKLLLFTERFWDNLVNFARRTTSQVEQWSRRYGMKETPEDLIRIAKGSDRYRAINLVPRNTIEIRIFRGTLNYNSFIATLQFTHALVTILKSLDISEVATVTWNDFINMLDKDYKELRKYLRERKLLNVDGDRNIGMPTDTFVHREDIDDDDESYDEDYDESDNLW